MNSYCHVTRQVNEHCNQEETFCENCGGNMYFINACVLECEDCLKQIDTNQEHGDYDDE